MARPIAQPHRSRRSSIAAADTERISASAADDEADSPIGPLTLLSCSVLVSLCSPLSLPSLLMSTAESAPSEKQAVVLEYLKSHRVNEELNIVVNKLCHQQTEDPFAFLVRRTQRSQQTTGKERSRERSRSSCHVAPDCPL